MKTIQMLSEAARWLVLAALVLMCAFSWLTMVTLRDENRAFRDALRQTIKTSVGDDTVTTIRHTDQELAEWLGLHDEALKARTK